MENENRHCNEENNSVHKWDINGGKIAGNVPENGPDKYTENTRENTPFTADPGDPKKGTLVSALFALGLVAASLLLVAGLRLGHRPGPYPEWLPGLKAQPAVAGDALGTADIVEKAGPSVASIELYRENSTRPYGGGSGVVLSESGYIATNAHVVHNAPLVRVVLQSGQGYTARVVGADPKNDLAVLKISAPGLVPAVFGDSAALRVGQRVVAIGNAAGFLPGTPSQGIISGLGRQVSIATVAGDVVFLDLLQTDASINPGNSGGALVNEWGQVVGISVAKLEEDGVENVGFAIPAAAALPVLEKLMAAEGDLPSLRLGLALTALNETTGPAMGLPGAGLYIEGIEPESSLVQYGVRAGDVILEAEGEALRDEGDLLRRLAECGPGDSLRLKVWLAATGESVTVEAAVYE